MGITLTVLRETQKAGAIFEVEPTADNEPDARLLGRHMGAHHARKRITIRNGNGRMAQFCRLPGQFMRMRSTAQKTEITGDLKLGITHVSSHCLTRTPHA